MDYCKKRSFYFPFESWSDIPCDYCVLLLPEERQNTQQEIRIIFIPATERFVCFVSKDLLWCEQFLSHAYTLDNNSNCLVLNSETQKIIIF